MKGEKAILFWLGWRLFGKAILLAVSVILCLPVAFICIDMALYLTEVLESLIEEIEDYERRNDAMRKKVGLPPPSTEP
jgi:multisubunit Na+/H+ antiporter MnhG subunit